MSKKVILKVQLHDEKAEKNAVEEVRGLQGFHEFYKDMKYENEEKDQKWIVIGDIDPIDLVIKLKKFCSTVELVTVDTKQEPENSSKEKKAVPEKGQEPKKKGKETKEEEPEPKKKGKETKEEEPEPKKKGKETKEEEPEPKKEKEPKKEERPKNDDVSKLVRAYQAYNPYKNV